MSRGNKESGETHGKDGPGVIPLGDLQTLLHDRYGVSCPSPRQLAGGWEGNVFFQSRHDSTGWVVRVLDPEAAAADAAVISFLEREHYPAPRVVRTRDGTATATHGPHSVLVTTSIGGSLADFSPATLCRLGERLGRLHALDVTAAPNLPPADMLPSTEMATALDWLRLPPAGGRIEAIVDGYATYRILTREEMDWLPYALRFRALVYGSGYLADTVARGLDVLTETWWWERY